MHHILIIIGSMPIPRPNATRRALLTWYSRSRRDLPWRRTRDPYRIWVSEIMLQQTTVRAVIPYYRRFLRRFPTLRSLSRARLPSVLAAWSGLGYYRRARHLHAAARMIVRDSGGRFPRAIDDLLDLPGIGRYTAGAILSIAFGQHHPVLDGNIARVLARWRLLRGDPASSAMLRRLWDLATTLVTGAAAPGDLNQALMELGATVCTPVAPGCSACPVRRGCMARIAGAQERIPLPRRRREPIVVRSAVALVTRDGRCLVRRRGRTGLLDGMWELPALDDGAGAGDLRLRRGPRLTTVRHTITYRRMLVDVHRAHLLAEPRGSDFRWIRPGRPGRLPSSSLLGKVFASLDAGRV